jgi:predicted O-linked N-acetylglucosamine transferase (SPINDLY family)
MITVWAKILTVLPQAHMLVVTGAGHTRNDWVRSVFAAHSVSAERLTLALRQEIEGYLRLFQHIDIVLDVYPFTGCNTTADALWMGVPVISRVGPSAATRQGLSILSQVGLQDLAATTPEAYVQTAVRLAHDLPRLRELRGQLRDRVKRGLGDVGRFTRELEAAYREMWKTYCGR